MSIMLAGTYSFGLLQLQGLDLGRNKLTGPIASTWSSMAQASMLSSFCISVCV